MVKKVVSHRFPLTTQGLFFIATLPTHILHYAILPVNAHNRQHDIPICIINHK